MIQNIYRKKIINSIVYFSKKVKYPSKVKIFKLLFFLDFIHFKETGRPVTNLEYFAWKYGPVPKELFLEISNSPQRDFSKSVAIIPIVKENDSAYWEFKAKCDFDKSIFTPHEIAIMEKLIYIFKDAKPSMMSEITHLKNSPWERTIREKGENALIDYLLSIDSEALLTLEEAHESATERSEIFKNYPISEDQ